MDINVKELVKLKIEELESGLQAEAKSVLQWALDHLQEGTWPRDDYREMLELLIISLGGEIPSFNFKLPGPDHHARWMSKVIYILKCRLVSNFFKMSEEERAQVDEIAKFCILYVQYFLQCPLASAAARNDLQFIAKVQKYRLVNPSVAFGVLQSCYRHLWYLTPQLIVLALTDKGLSESVREDLAKALHSCERRQISPGKPVFPVLEESGEDILSNIPTIVSHESWLIFQLLGLDGPQDWLLTPANLWPLFKAFRDLEEFSANLKVCNDVAERGIHLMSEFIDHCEDEEQRQALFQCVEFHRQLVPKSTKEYLSLT